MKSSVSIFAAALAFLALAAPEGLRAAEAGADAFDFFLQEAQVVSASRHAQKKSDSPVAIDIITKDDIAASGAQSIVDVLRFRVGVDVAAATSIEGNSAMVSVRGLPSEFQQNMQVLVDGRSVVSAVNSGVFWNSLPVSLDDIERIEIVRGPNAALYGANAGQGVINIITKKPVAGSSGAELKTVWGDKGAQSEYGSLSYGEGGYRGRVSYDRDVKLSDPSPSGATNNDLNSQPVNARVFGRLDLDLGRDLEAELYGGHTVQSYNIPPVLGVSHGGVEETWGMAQAHQKLGDDSVDVTVSGRKTARVYGQALTDELVWDADALGRFSLLDGKSLSTVGASMRYAGVASDFLFNANVDSGGSEAQAVHSSRAYAQEAYDPAAWVSFALAASFEDSDLGGQWPAYQGAVILKPAENHSLRLSASKSPTMPSLMNQRGNIFIPVSQVHLTDFGSLVGPDGGTSYPAGSYVQATQVEPTQVGSYEATWTSSLLDRHLTAEITAYQMEVQGQIMLNDSTPPDYQTANTGGMFSFAPLPGGGYAIVGAPDAHTGQYTNYYFTYLNHATVIMRGLETVLTFKPRAGTTLQLNHTYEEVTYSVPGGYKSPFLETTTPWNKVNLLAQSELPWGFNAGAQVGWVGGHDNYQASRGTNIWIEDQATLDLRLGYRPLPALELFAVAENLDHALRTEGGDGTAVPQQYYAGLNLAFGGK